MGKACVCWPCPAQQPKNTFAARVNDGSGEVDYDMAREYLAPHFDALRIEAEIVRYRAAADRLVRADWAQHRIQLVAAALVKRGSLSGDDIGALGFSANVTSECGKPHCR
jgi:hypothetical protein